MCTKYSWASCSDLAAARLVDDDAADALRIEERAAAAAAAAARAQHDADARQHLHALCETG